MMTGFDLTQNIVPISVVAAAGLIIFVIVTWAMIIAARRIMNVQQFNQFKRSPAAWILPVVTGLIILTAQLVFLFIYLGQDSSAIWKPLSSWAIQHGLAIVIIALVSYILIKVVGYLIPPAMNNYVQLRSKGRTAKQEVKKRADVLSKFLIRMTQIIVGILAAFMILSEFGINITPLLAGAGVVGIAIGFGSQKLISDLINGIFIMVDDYYSVGDVVQVANISGLVEEINIRRTVLRDLDGVVHIIPNSEIKIASNFTRNWSRVNLNVPVSYDTDLDKAISVLNRVGMELSKDKGFKDMIITPPQVLRVDNFADSAIEIKMLGDTKPIKQWDVTGELRKRIKKAFDEENIEIPWPTTKVYFGSNLTVEKKNKT